MEAQDALYGCVFCKTGREAETARRLCDVCACLRATPVSRAEFRYEGGKKSQVRTIMLPGYVFFIADEQFLPFRLWQISDILRLLTDTEQSWRLTGDDLAFAKWVFDHDGLIGLSKALETGTKVRLLSGPMKDYEGSIVRIDRHARSGIVAVRFNNTTLHLKLSFELVKEI